ncbi:MAG: hypothetical protein IKZ50_01715 [Bacteroidales bacterium]|nr:hypothetical protein [Bacteroidales bacterium]
MLRTLTFFRSPSLRCEGANVSVCKKKVFIGNGIFESGYCVTCRALTGRSVGKMKDGKR